MDEAPPANNDAASARAPLWLAGATLVLLWAELVSRLRFEWSVNPQYGYGWTVPFLAAYLFWRRCENAPAPAQPARSASVMFAIVVAALLLPPVRLIQEANPDWRLLSWTMAIAIGGMTVAGIYLSSGVRVMRHFIFPIAFFMVAVPWPTQFEQLIIQGLMRADAAINVEILNVIGIAAVQLGNVIEVGSGFVGIDEACTGIRSLQATLMVSLFLGEFYNFSVRRRVVLVVSGAILAFLCNLARTFLLVWLGAERGIQAIQKWHDPAGVTILVACLFGLWVLSMLLQRGADPVPPRRHSRSPFLPVSRALLVTVLAIAVSAEATTQWWYRSHETESSRLKPWSVTWPRTAANWQDVPVADSAKDILRYNEGGGANWTGADGHNWTMYFFKWLPGRTAGLFIKNHRPDVCLPASGMAQRGGARNRLMTVNGVTLPMRSYVFESAGQTLHVFYCYWDGMPPQPDSTDAENWTASGRLDAVKRGKRDVGTQMLEIVAWGYDDDAAAEAAAREQLSAIVRPG